MKRIKQILAWLALIAIAGLLIATVVLSIQGSQLSLPLLALTMGVSVAIWVLFWFLGLVAKKTNTVSEDTAQVTADKEDESKES